MHAVLVRAKQDGKGLLTQGCNSTLPHK